MNLAFEYLVRTGLCRTYLKLPCSLFLTSVDDGRVLTIHEKDTENYLIKHWHIWECEKDQILPPVKDFIVPKEEVWVSDKTILADFCPLMYYIEPVPYALNSYRNPMSQYIFNIYHDHFLDSEYHKMKRKKWLWSIFVDIYLNDWDFWEYPTIRDVKRTSPRLGNIWSKWHQRFLKPYPGEFVFWGVYSDWIEVLN
jgi:hypothetical protein